jgi:hypothetical protein
MHRRGRANTAALVVLLGACAVVVAAAVTGPTEEAAELRVKTLSGRLELLNSRDGLAIATASGMSPGDSVDGDVRIENTGDDPVELWLLQPELNLARGANGGELSDVLQLRITRNRGRPRTVYQGALSAMPWSPVGRLRAGVGRRFEFQVTFPDNGTPPSPTGGDNAYQGARVDATFIWRAGPAAAWRWRDPPVLRRAVR